MFWVYSVKNNSLEYINCIDIKSVDDFSNAISLLSYNSIKKDAVIEKIKTLERQDLTKIAKTRNVGFSITGFDDYENRSALEKLILKHEDDVISMAKILPLVGSMEERFRIIAVEVDGFTLGRQTSFTSVDDQAAQVIAYVQKHYTGCSETNLYSNLMN